MMDVLVLGVLAVFVALTWGVIALCGWLLGDGR
jgi:hypothetical protein